MAQTQNALCSLVPALLIAVFLAFAFAAAHAAPKSRLHGQEPVIPTGGFVEFAIVNRADGKLVAAVSSHMENSTKFDCVVAAESVSEPHNSIDDQIVHASLNPHDGWLRRGGKLRYDFSRQKIVLAPDIWARRLGYGGNIGEGHGDWERLISWIVQRGQDDCHIGRWCLPSVFESEFKRMVTFLAAGFIVGDCGAAIHFEIADTEIGLELPMLQLAAYAQLEQAGSRITKIRTTPSISSAVLRRPFCF